MDLQIFLDISILFRHSPFVPRGHFGLFSKKYIISNKQVLLHFFYSKKYILFRLSRPDVPSEDAHRPFKILQCNTTATQTLTADSIVWDLADTPWSVFWERLPCLPLELFSLCLSVWTRQSVKIFLANFTPLSCLSWHHQHQVSKADGSKRRLCNKHY